MGQELECKARLGREVSTGKAMLEGDHLLFRGTFRVKAMFKDLQSLEASNGVLRLTTAEGMLSLELGAAAEKWKAKILNPPSRLDKLGVKPTSAVALIGEFDARFEEEVRERTQSVVTGRPRAKCDLIFVACPDRAALARAGQLIPSLKPAGAIWIVYPKGVRSITEDDVLTAARGVGLADTKVVSFSATHTALKFVIRVADR